MHISRMEKKLAAGKYESITAFMKDVYLIRDNAYTYNTDKGIYMNSISRFYVTIVIFDVASIEVRLLADALVDYFKHLFRVALKDISNSKGSSLSLRISSFFNVH